MDGSNLIYIHVQYSCCTSKEVPEKSSKISQNAKVMAKPMLRIRSIFLTDPDLDPDPQTRA